MISDFLYVAFGGALGAMARYGISLLPIKSAFPILTLCTNFLGALVIGFVTGLASANPSFPQKWTLFLKTGVCGGFTTFSTFSLEALTLLEQHKYLPGISYILLSVVLCLAGVYAGRAASMLLP